jgi:hypothetical protein
MLRKLRKRMKKSWACIVLWPWHIAFWLTDILEDAALAVLHWARECQEDLMGEGDD